MLAQSAIILFWAPRGRGNERLRRPQYEKFRNMEQCIKHRAILDAAATEYFAPFVLDLERRIEPIFLVQRVKH